MKSFFKSAFICFLTTTNLSIASAPSDFSHPHDNPKAAATALTTYERVNEAWAYPGTQEGGRCETYSVDSGHWEQKHYTLNEELGYASPYLVKKGNAPLSEALEDLVSNPAISECATAMYYVLVTCGA